MLSQIISDESTNGRCSPYALTIVLNKTSVPNVLKLSFLKLDATYPLSIFEALYPCKRYFATPSPLSFFHHLSLSGAGRFSSTMNVMLLSVLCVILHKETGCALVQLEISRDAKANSANILLRSCYFFKSL